MAEERRGYLARVGPLLLATAIACSAAAGGLTDALDEPAFEGLLHVMVLLAVGTSALSGRFNRNTTFIGLIVIAVAVAGLAQRLAPVPGVELLYPPEAVADEDLTWATLWAWLMVGFCFMLGRRTNVLFPLVAGLAIFGLVGTINLNTSMLVYFGVFIFAVIFIWGYEHLLNVGEKLSAGRVGEWIEIARTQAMAGTLLVAVLIVAGLLIGSGLYHVGPRVFVGRGGMTSYARYLQRSLLSYGGMLNSFRVGQGPVNLPAAPAISVESDKPALWRGSVYDHYTGDGWTREQGGTRRLQRGEDGWYTLREAEDLVGERNVQRVRILNMETRAMYAAAQPVKIRMTEDSWEQTQVRYVPQLDPYGTLRTQYMMTGNAQYEVVSVMPPTDADTLRATPAEYPPGIVETYVEQMQVQAEAELSGLVADITEDAYTPYDRVQAIREFLGRSCVYTTRAPAVPRGDDAAVWFVNNKRRGACDLFATSLAVMARLAGVPARVATGFQTGTYDPEAGAYVAKQRDAHAWAEIYFTGIGWVPFDVAAQQMDNPDQFLAWLRSGQWRREVDDVVTAIGRVLIVVLGVAALLSAVLGPGVLIRWLRNRARRSSPRERLGEAFEWFRRKAARLAGVRPRRWRTPAEVQRQLAAEGLANSPAVRERLSDFTDRFYEHRYGRTEPTDQQIGSTRNEARELLRELRQDLNKFGRRRDGDKW